MKLSICIATFNEEKFIKYPLDSAYDIADEVIIVDGGSTDKTLEIAQSYGDKVKIISTDNPPMFHINKQKALDAATGDWILQLDADEALSEGLKMEIVAIVGDKTSAEDKGDGLFNFVAYWVPRKNFFLTRFLEKGGQYPDYTIRFYRNGAVRFPCKTVHENVELISDISPASVHDYVGTTAGEPKSTKYNNYTSLKASHQNAESSHSLGYLKKPLLHYADPDFSRYLLRWDRYTTLDANLMAKNGEIDQVVGAGGMISYFFLKPAVTFFLMYFRHKGFMDGFPGFVFALFSSIRFWLIYIKVWQKKIQLSK